MFLHPVYIIGSLRMTYDYKHQIKLLTNYSMFLVSQDYKSRKSTEAIRGHFKVLFLLYACLNSTFEGVNYF